MTTQHVMSYYALVAKVVTARYQAEEMTYNLALGINELVAPWRPAKSSDMIYLDEIQAWLSGLETERLRGKSPVQLALDWLASKELIEHGASPEWVPAEGPVVKRAGELGIRTCTIS